MQVWRVKVHINLNGFCINLCLCAGHAEVKSKSAHRGKPRNISSKKRTATERRGKGATKKGQEAKKRKADQEGYDKFKPMYKIE